MGWVEGGHTVGWVEGGHTVGWVEGGHTVGWVEGGHIVRWVEGGHSGAGSHQQCLTLSGVPLFQTLGNFTDMDSYYDMVDDIEALDMEGIMKVGGGGKKGWMKW